MSHKPVKYLFLLITLGLLISNGFAISESLGNTVKPVMPYAALSANKYIEKTNLTLGETTLVVVNITNFGNLTAYNVKIEEPLVPVGIIKLETKPHLDTLSQLMPNSSYVYYYKFKAESLGDYFIPPTVVSWNSNGTNYTVSSQGYTIHVYEEIVETKTSTQWWIIFGISVGTMLIPAIPIFWKKFVKK